MAMKTIRRSCLLLMLLSFACSDSSDDEPEEDATLFVSKAEMLAATQGSALNIVEIFAAGTGDLLLRDTVSKSLIVVGTAGGAGPFVSEQDITDLTGEATASLGRIDQIRLGTLADQILTADETSGLLIRIRTDGTPLIHSTEAQIIAVTGEASARMHLPRYFAINQIMAQDLVSGDLLLIGNNGAPSGQPLATAAELATAAGLPVDQAVVAEWIQGGETGAQFARFDGVNHIVRLQINSTLERFIDGADLDALFPDIADVQLLDFVADFQTDGMLLRIGDGARGVAIGAVFSDGSLGVFTSEQQLVDLAGSACDISDIGLLPSGLPYAVDAGGGQIIVLQSDGAPLILASRADVERAAGTAAPELTIASRIFSERVIVFETNLDNLLSFQ